MSTTWRLFMGYGLPLIAANAVYQLMPFLNRGVIALHQDFAEAGYYALASDVTGRSLTTLGTALDLLLFQLAVRAEETDGRAAAEAQVERNAGVVVALLLPCAVGFWAVLPALQETVVPQAYRGPFALYSVVLIPGLFCLSMMFFALNPIFQIRRRTLPVIAAAGVGLAANLLGLLVLPALVGGVGIALAQSLGLASAFLWLAVRALTGSDRLHLPWREIAAAAAACLAMGLALAPFRHLEPTLALATCLPLGIGLYGVLVWIFDIAGLRGHVLARFRPAYPAPAE